MSTTDIQTAETRRPTAAGLLGKIVLNAVTCGICQSPADKHGAIYICQANPNHMGDRMTGIFNDRTPPPPTTPAPNEAPEPDCVRCPHCNTDKLTITYRPGYRACWECGAELAADFPDESIWEFHPNPYGWTRRAKPGA
jgi:hypothetical protein